MVPEKVYKFDKKVNFQHFRLFGAPLGHIFQQELVLTKFFSERSLQSDWKMYLHRSDISNIREGTIRDVFGSSSR